MADERNEKSVKVVMRKEVHHIPAVHAPKPVQGFVDFIREQGVVGLAVGLTLGVAAKSVVDALVGGIFNPLVGLIGGGSGDLGSRYICLKHVNNSCTNKLGFGSVISSLISFLIVAAVVYFAVKGLKLDRLDKKKDE